MSTLDFGLAVGWRGGSAALIVTSDVGGAANASATFAMDVKAVGTPVEFDYLEANPQSNTDTAKPVKA